MIKGASVIDGLVLVDLRYDGPTRSLTGRAALVDEKGKTHGLTHGHPVWSQPTLEKLQELIQAMEADFAKVHLAAGGEAVEEEAPGLGELFARSRSQPR